MKKNVAAILFLSASLVASDISYPGLFAHVVHIADDDTLNVRERPDYHSKKTGELPIDAFVGVDYCTKKGKSTWCRIFHLAQRNYAHFGYGAKPGWVNARYLDFDNSGYVIIDGKPDCDYALRCTKSRCEVVDDYTTDAGDGHISALKTRWIERERLKASDRFSAMRDDPDASGYCTTDRGNAFLQMEKEKTILEKSNDPLQKKIRKIVSLLHRLEYGGKDGFAAYVHPLKGVVMSWHVHFGGENDIRFKREDIQNIQKRRDQKRFWGYTYGKGDEVYMSLFEYMAKLTKPLNIISQTVQLKTLKGFVCPPQTECKGYEVFWRDENTKTPEYDWQGLVMIFERYQGKWYVVGLLRDRWTI
ncbi:hypothetical protein MNB_SV-4-652 [hydrothermal vent metagenome]|uniref:SH3b domain-containing protein n=1 Tax=hydrothermal vent metagenome TaxID=652676 RepID=A0A1W1EAB1_9ZZZZ